MSGFRADPGMLQTLADATVDQRAAIAQQIVNDVKEHYPTAEVVVDGDRVSATTYGSFDHLKEWGSVNNPPHFYMRMAAAKRGRFTPE